MTANLLNLGRNLQTTPASFGGSERKPLPRGFLKALVYSLVTVASAAGVSYAYKLFLEDRLSLFYFVVVIAVFLVIDSLQIFIPKAPGWSFLFFVSESAALLSFFYNFQTEIILAAFVLILIFLEAGEIFGKKELDNGLKIKFFRSVRIKLAYVATALSVFLVLVYVPIWKPGDLFFSKSDFEKIMGRMAEIAGLPEDFSIGSLITMILKVQTKESEVLKSLSPELRIQAEEQAIKASAEQFLKSFGGALGKDVKFNDSASSVVYDFIISSLNKWASKFGKRLVWGWAVLAFFVLRGIGTIFNWGVAIISFIFYNLLLAFNFFYVKNEQVVKEVVELA